MKKVILAVMAVMFVFAVTSAIAEDKPAEKKAAAPAAAPKKAKSIEVSGKVEAVVAADAAKKTDAEVTIVPEKGDKITVKVKATTTIYEGKNNITLDKIVKDTKVKIKYVMKKKINEALSIIVEK